MIIFCKIAKVDTSSVDFKMGKDFHYMCDIRGFKVFCEGTVGEKYFIEIFIEDEDFFWEMESKERFEFGEFFTIVIERLEKFSLVSFIVVHKEDHGKINNCNKYTRKNFQRWKNGKSAGN